MSGIPSKYLWMTQSGDKLDIRWMASAHLVHAANMLMRKNGIKLRQIDAITEAHVFRSMISEIRARGLYSAETLQYSYDQFIVPKFAREDYKTLCLMRAFFDMGRSWPGILDVHGALSCIRHQFESALQSLQSYAEKGNEDAQQILTKFTEYRLLK